MASRASYPHGLNRARIRAHQFLGLGTADNSDYPKRCRERKPLRWEIRYKGTKNYSAGPWASAAILALSVQDIFLQKTPGYLCCPFYRLQSEPGRVQIIIRSISSGLMASLVRS